MTEKLLTGALNFKINKQRTWLQLTLHPHDLGLVPLVSHFIRKRTAYYFFSLHSASDRLQTNPDPVIEVSTPVIEVDLCEEETSTNA